MAFRAYWALGEAKKVHPGLPREHRAQFGHREPGLGWNKGAQARKEVALTRLV